MNLPLLRNAAGVMTLPALLATLLLAGVGLGGCRVDREPAYEWLPWLNSMEFSSAAETNTKNANFKNGLTMQVPPAGTIPRGFKPLHYTAAEAERAGGDLKNPLEATPENLARGKERFGVFCSPCHGPVGAGDGLVVKRNVGFGSFPINNPLAGPGTWPDGKVFHMISFGRGNMPSYATQIPQEDRWRIVLHLRELQKANK